MQSIQRSLLILSLLFVWLAAACAPASTPPPTAMATEAQSVPPVASAELTGATLYLFSCSACHGKDRAGSTFELAGQTIKVPALDWHDLNIVFKADPSRGSIAEQVALAITKGEDPGGGE